MAGPDFHYPQRRRARRRHKPARSRRMVGSNLWLTPVMAVAFVAALAGFQKMPAGLTADAPGATAMPFLRGDAAGDTLSARFGLCHSGGGTDCVVDGDTFWHLRVKIRIADIDAPELSPPHCETERMKGEAAKRRLLDLLNAGPFSLVAADRDEDRLGCKLRVVRRAGHSLGATLIAEGLARPWGGPRRNWCD